MMDTLEYQSLLNGERFSCHIESGVYGPAYVDVGLGLPAFLHQHPISGLLRGIRVDELTSLQDLFVSALRQYLIDVRERFDPGIAPVIQMTDAVAAVFAGRKRLTESLASFVLDLPGDTRPEKNKARLRDHLLLASGIAAALGQALMLQGLTPGQLCGVSRFDEREALALLRLAALCHDLGKHPPQGHIERGVEFIYRIFNDVLDNDIVNEIAEAAKHHHASRRHRLAGIAPETTLQEIVAFADSVASGADRPGVPGFNFPGYDDVREFEDKFFGDGNRALALIAADVDCVQEYVFESAKLPEMRGASLLLDALNLKDNDDEGRWGDLVKRGVKGIPQILYAEFLLPQESIIYAGGGSALIVAPLKKAEEIKHRIERLYIEITHKATITVVYHPVRLHELALGIQPQPPRYWFGDQVSKATGRSWELLKANLICQREWTQIRDASQLNDAHYHSSKRFGQWQTALSYALRRAKDSKLTAPLFEVSPFTERCEFCQLRPASEMSDDKSPKPICRVCDTKRGQKGKRKGFYLSDFRDYLEAEAEASEYAQSLSQWDIIQPAEDLEAVARAAKSSRVRSFIGIIYADGNNLGAMLESLETPVEFKTFAEGVRTTLKRSVFHGIAKFIPEPRPSKEGQLYHPFEIVSIGGDDVYLFVPADVALELACRICRQVEEEFNKQITLSAGVLLAHVNTPIYFSRTLVRGLLKSAKKLSKYDPSKPPASAIDFLVVTTDTAASEDIDFYRQKAYCNKQYHQEEWLTERPFTLEWMEKLVETVKQLKQAKFPKTQFYALRNAVVRGPQPRASNFYHYQIARHREKEGYDDLEKFLLKGTDQSEIAMRRLPFHKWESGFLAGDELTTPLVDLVEIYDFVRS